MIEFTTTTVEFDEKLADKNLIENDFSCKDNDGGLTPDEVKEVQEDLIKNEVSDGNN